MSQQLTMSWSEWFAHDGVALAGRVREGELRADDVIAQAVAAVERVDDRLEGVLEVFEDVAQDANADRPAPDGVLCGVPLFLKDLGSRMAGRNQESGSRLMRGNVSEVSDPLVDNFLRAGLVPLGRATTPEFGMTFDTSTDYLGRPKVTRNPWNLERTPGGSSGGSAALVAAGVTPISMASDGGGSTRIPASYCGLVGLKASRGRVSMPLNHSEYTWRIAVEGVVTRSVRDSAAALDYLHRKPAGGTFYPMAPPEGSWLEGLQCPPGPLRIALSTGPWGREGACDLEVADKIRNFARVLEGLGHHVDEVGDETLCDWPAMWKGYITQWICSRMNYLPLAERRAPGTPLEELLSPIAWRHVEGARSYSTLDLLQAMADNNVVTRKLAGFFERADLLLCPTHAIRVPPANGPYSLLHDDALDAWVGRLADACRYTMPGNEAGLPGISLPAGWDRDGLPVGAMLYAAPGREDLLLRLAAVVEAERPEWFGQRPPVSVLS